MSKTMIDPENTFPASAIPQFINLIKLFNYTLRETIENLKEDSQRSDFEKIKAHLHHEIEWFTHNIINWRNSKLSPQEQQELEMLQPLFEEAKEFFSIIEKKPTFH